VPGSDYHETTFLDEKKYTSLAEKNERTGSTVANRSCVADVDVETMALFRITL